MSWSFLFFFNSVLLGVGLAMDAFSVSLANGLSFPDMKAKSVISSSLLFAFFQALMPMIGWVCVQTVVERFSSLSAFIPYIAFALLLFIGSGMIREGRRECGCAEKERTLAFSTLLLQAVATSIDALSVGFTISTYPLSMAIVAALIIAAVTFAICVSGVVIGKKFGCRYAGRASVFGGVILCLIGLEILVSSFF